MKRYLSVLALSLGILPLVTISQASAQGQRGTPEQQRACRPDAARYCRGMSDDRAIESCLRANFSRLRPACRRIFEGR